MPAQGLGVAHWTSVANTFKTYPNVIFEPYNEPGSSQNITWAQWKSGGTLTDYFYDDGSDISGSSNGYAVVNVTWQTEGMQAMVTAIRATGATNVISCGGLQYAEELGSNGYVDPTSTWLESMPTDPINQLAASLHLYPNVNSSYGGTNYYRWYGADPNAGGSYEQFIPWVQQLNAAKIPVLITENGGANGTTATYPNEPFVTNTVDFVDTQNAAAGNGSAHYLMWSYTPNFGEGGDSPVWLNGTAVTPNGGTGYAVFDWMSAHAAP